MSKTSQSAHGMILHNQSENSLTEGMLLLNLSRRPSSSSSETLEDMKITPEAYPTKTMKDSYIVYRYALTPPSLPTKHSWAHT